MSRVFFSRSDQNSGLDSDIFVFVFVMTLKRMPLLALERFLIRVKCINAPFRYSLYIRRGWPEGGEEANCVEEVY
jgi:hypothetical protein